MKWLAIWMLTVFSCLSFVEIGAFLPDKEASNEASGRVVDTIKIIIPALLLIRPGTRVAEAFWLVLLGIQFTVTQMWGTLYWRFIAQNGTIIFFWARIASFADFWSEIKTDMPRITAEKCVQSAALVALGLYKFLCVVALAPPDTDTSTVLFLVSIATVTTALLLHGDPSAVYIETAWRISLVTTLFVQVFLSYSADDNWGLLFCHATTFMYLSVAYAVAFFYFEL